LVIAYRFDENSVEESRFPSREELDHAVPDLPLLLRRVDGHSCVVNTAAAISLRSVLGHDPEPIIRARDNDIVAHWFHRHIAGDGILSVYHQVSELAMDAGLVGLHAMVGDAACDPLHYEIIRDHLQDYPITITLYPQILDVERARNLGSPRVGGCILIDGSIGSHTAAVKTPYADDPGNTGKLYRTDAEWLEFYRNATENGLQVAVHVIGDAGVEQVLRTCEQIPGVQALRHILIHTEMMTDEQVERAAAQGLHAAMQPVFDALWGGPNGLYEHCLGKERVKRMNRYRSLTDHGICIAGSSDWYITDLDPLAGIRAAIHHHNPSERISPFEALRMYCTNHARLSFTESERGLIKPGYRADFTLLSADPVECPDSVQVTGVVINGQVRWK
jgi:predicted amidohydrolase YtcJ